MGNLSLYIHIPFCVKKCHYCDFLSAPCEENTKQEYVNVLCEEIVQRAKDFKDKEVDTVFFGGGTPSVLTGEQMTQIMTTIKDSFAVLLDAEISMEMNPGTVDAEKLRTYKELGINRISIGLQSANNEELKVLGRIHMWEDFLKTWQMVRNTGFTNVNIDLMSALPGQTMESYEDTLQKVLDLNPEHISAYSLIIEEGTLFYQWFGEKEQESEKLSKEDGFKLEKALGKIREKELPDETTERKMYEITEGMLKEKGYYRYEISNYALPGYECKHNIGYWKRKEYLGLGLGAASLLFEESLETPKKNIRSSNVSDLNCYLKNGAGEEINSTLRHKNKKMEDMNAEIEEKTEQTEVVGVKKGKWIQEQTYLTTEEQMEEFMFLGLRMMEGICPKEFEKQFDKTFQEVYGSQIEKLQNQGLLEYKNETERYALTKHGIDVSNQVFVEFLLD